MGAMMDIVDSMPEPAAPALEFYSLEYLRERMFPGVCAGEAAGETLIFWHASRYRHGFYDVVPWSEEATNEANERVMSFLPIKRWFTRTIPDIGAQVIALHRR